MLLCGETAEGDVMHGRSIGEGALKRIRSPRTVCRDHAIAMLQPSDATLSRPLHHCIPENPFSVPLVSMIPVQLFTLGAPLTVMAGSDLLIC